MKKSETISEILKTLQAISEEAGGAFTVPFLGLRSGVNKGAIYQFLAAYKRKTVSGLKIKMINRGQYVVMKAEIIQHNITEKIGGLTQEIFDISRAEQKSVGHGDQVVADDYIVKALTEFTKGYDKVVQQIGVLQNALLTKNKFEKLVRYRAANLFYLVTPEHILKKYEVPLGWGLLMKAGNGLTLIQQPTWIEATDGARLAVLQKMVKHTS